jgi:nitrogen fixation NifU-like protein
MSDLDDLYQAVILEHDRAPRHYGRLAAASGSAEGYNPLCGDRLCVTVALAGEQLTHIMFDADGCAISRASASLMTDFLAGRSIAETQRLARAFEALLRDREAGTISDELAALAPLTGVRRFPSRIRCATLAWHALLDALSSSGCPR